MAQSGHFNCHKYYRYGHRNIQASDFSFGGNLMQTCRRLIFAVAVMFGGLSQTDAALGAPQSVHEEMFVPIGGIDQWVTIKGDNRDKPVLLYLHGGPGNAASPFADSLFAGWEKDFIMVQWDQRGAGRTYRKTGPSIASTMTLAKMTQDAAEVADFLARHLGKKKIIVMGASWGSILGVHVVRERPDLFYAYVGLAQVVNVQASAAASYARLRALALAAADHKAIALLEEIGLPPWNALSRWGKFRSVQQPYQEKLSAEPAASQKFSPAYSSTEERAQWRVADDFNWEHFVGIRMSGELMQVDLAAQGTDFSVPVFIVQGEEDLTASPELARKYFESIKAPTKKFYLVPSTGHDPSTTLMNLIHKVLIDQVRPLVGSK